MPLTFALGEEDKMEITKTRCLISRSGKIAGHFNADTIFIDSIPYVVFEWERQSDGTEKPAHIVRLDPQYFHPLAGWGEATHMYEHPVIDPRAFD